MVANRVDWETGSAVKLGNIRLSRWAEGYEREQGRIRCERRVKNNERRGERGDASPIWDQPLHWACFRRERMLPGRARRATRPVDEDRVDMTV